MLLAIFGAWFRYFTGSLMPSVFQRDFQMQFYKVKCGIKTQLQRLEIPTEHNK